MTAFAQPLIPGVICGLEPVALAEANDLLVRWDHYLGPVNRPFGSQAWVLHIDGEPVSTAVSCSTVGESAGGVARGEAVELARLCSGQRWATRPMLRLWREVCAPRWPYWFVTAAVAYSQTRRHDGDIYRWDGWTLADDNCGSQGGGTWSRKRYATDAATGRKRCWVWRYTP